MLTLYESELERSAISALDAGGFVKLSNFDDGRFVANQSSLQNHPKSSSTTTYYPKTNSFYIFPGYFVAHAVFKVELDTVRYSVVMFIKLRNGLIGGLSPDKYLRREWAASNLDGKKEVCDRCWSAFDTPRNLRRHKRRSKICMLAKVS